MYQWLMLGIKNTRMNCQRTTCETILQWARLPPAGGRRVLKKEASVEARGSQSRSIIARICLEEVHRRFQSAPTCDIPPLLQCKGSSQCVQGHCKAMRPVILYILREWNTPAAERRWSLLLPLCCCSPSWKTLASKSHKSYVCVRGKCAFLFLKSQCIDCFLERSLSDSGTSYSLSLKLDSLMRPW